jgi:hypothetical protein
MALFNFNDDKSRRQIDKANNFRNNTDTLNAQNLEAYQRKMTGLADSRREWEVEDSVGEVK